MEFQWRGRADTLNEAVAKARVDRDSKMLPMRVYWLSEATGPWVEREQGVERGGGIGPTDVGNRTQSEEGS